MAPAPMHGPNWLIMIRDGNGSWTRPRPIRTQPIYAGMGPNFLDPMVWVGYGSYKYGAGVGMRPLC